LTLQRIFPISVKPSSVEQHLASNDLLEARRGRRCSNVKQKRIVQMNQKKWTTLAAAAATVVFLPCAAMAQGSGSGGNGNQTGNIPSQRYSVTNPAGRGAILTVSSAGVREVQQSLNRLGYSAGPITGSWNKRTQRSMREFQSARGLEPTGNLDISSIDALGLWQKILGNPAQNGRGAALAQATGAPAARGGSAANGQGSANGSTSGNGGGYGSGANQNGSGGATYGSGNGSAGGSGGSSNQ